MSEVYPINIWINEERYEKLQQAGLANLAKEKMAGLKVLAVPTNEQQKDEILKLFPMAKFDSATTKSIELLPRDVKDRIFDLIIQKKTVDVIQDFIEEEKKKRG
ncbi:MAG: hypothetical protein D6778_01840 [Nitrospirae bacterium]|nr:MAG: hypothetical protein D6778_01840 [Nitrospirota bacterium]